MCCRLTLIVAFLAQEPIPFHGQFQVPIGCQNPFKDHSHGHAVHHGGTNKPQIATVQDGLVSERWRSYGILRKEGNKGLFLACLQKRVLDKTKLVEQTAWRFWEWPWVRNNTVNVRVSLL